MLRKRITNLIVAIASISGFVVAAPVVMAEVLKLRFATPLGQLLIHLCKSHQTPTV
jgi:hypothetical protein